MTPAQAQRLLIRFRTAHCGALFARMFELQSRKGCLLCVSFGNDALGKKKKHFNLSIP